MTASLAGVEEERLRSGMDLSELSSMYTVTLPGYRPHLGGSNGERIHISRNFRERAPEPVLRMGCGMRS
jgi:hypothetical protein